MKMLVFDPLGSVIGSVSFSGWDRRPLGYGEIFRFPLVNYQFKTIDFIAKKAHINGQVIMVLIREKNWSSIDEILGKVPELSEIESWESKELALNWFLNLWSIK